MRSDDSSLDANELRVVESRARQTLDKASAWGRFPTPVDDILAASKLRLASKSIFDPAALLKYIQEKTAQAGRAVKSALSKILGLYDTDDLTIHIDQTVGRSKQTFLKLHETGHHVMPTHRKVFSLFQDCEQTLAPHIADQFEREANNFARFALFQGDCFTKMAADMPMAIRSPMTLAGKFGASIYASAREFARTHHRACIVYVLDLPEKPWGPSSIFDVRRIEPSPAFRERFGLPQDGTINLDHPLAELIPIGRKMTRPRSLVFRDLNGDDHECLGEGFNTTHNILLLVYPIKELSGSSIYLPPTLTSKFSTI